MGILNVTPDSFSDGGRFTGLDRAVEHARAMVAAGAGIIDVGGESTRPGAGEVAQDEEIRRVVPVIEALAADSNVVISIDTSKPVVMLEAMRAGASLINDVRALRQPEALEVAAASDAGICLMHMRGEPRTMQAEPHYEDVVAEVRAFLLERVDACIAAGIAPERIVLDPGIGFGKSVEHNVQLLARLPRLRELGYPLLIGASRKSMFGALLGRGVDERLAGGLSIATASILAGVSVIRTHDVVETVDAVKMAAVLRDADYQIEEKREST